MSDHRPDGGAEEAAHRPALLSDEPTIELVVRARAGDRDAVEALLQRCLPHLKRWAHGRLPASARGSLDTGDLVQEAAMHAIRRLDTFQPQHVGAMQAYLQKSVINLIRDEVRRVTRHPAPMPLPEDQPSDSTSPIEVAMKEELYQHYRQALGSMRPRDKEMLVARVDLQWTVPEIAKQFGMRTDAARMALMRALRRLNTKLKRD